MHHLKWYSRKIMNCLIWCTVSLVPQIIVQGSLAPILGPIYGKVPEREPIFLNDSSKSSMDTQKLIPVEILTYFFRFGD